MIRPASAPVKSRAELGSATAPRGGCRVEGCGLRLEALEGQRHAPRVGACASGWCAPVPGCAVASGLVCCFMEARYKATESGFCPKKCRPSLFAGNTFKKLGKRVRRSLSGPTHALHVCSELAAPYRCRPPPPPPPRRSRSTSSSAPSPTRGPPTAPRSARRAPPTRRAAGAAAAPRRRTRASRTRSASRRATATSSRSRAGPRRASAWTTRCCPSRTSVAPRRGRPTRAGSGSTTRPAARTSCGAPC